MKENFNLLFKDLSIRLITIGSVLFFVFQIALLAIMFFSIPPIVPLYNSLPWGEARLAPRELLVVVPFSLVIIAIINYTIVIKIYKKHTLIARMLVVNVFLLAFLAALALLQIMFLVF